MSATPLTRANTLVDGSSLATEEHWSRLRFDLAVPNKEGLTVPCSEHGFELKNWHRLTPAINPVQACESGNWLWEFGEDS